MTTPTLRVLRMMALAALAVAAARGASAATLYTITELPASQQGSTSAGLRLNEDGAVLGRDGGRTVLFRDGAVIDLSGIAGPGGSIAGLNDAGHLAGTRLNSAGQSRVFVSSSGGTSNFPSLGYPGELAVDLNNNDVVVGDMTLADGSVHAGFWNNYSVHDLGVMSNDTNSHGAAINTAGQVAGNSGDRGFIWTYSTGMVDIGALGGPGAATVVQDINDSGWLVGYSELTPHGRVSGFLYDGVALQPIGDIGQLFPSLNSFARAINSAGDVVGDAQRDDGVLSAFLYREGATFELQSLIDPTLGWDLRSATDINDRGQITGYGFIDGRQSAFLLTPITDTGAVPEPGTWALMILGLGLAGSALRRRGRIAA